MIKGLARRARYPRLGIIRLGVKRVNKDQKEYPAEVPWFVLPSGLGLDKMFGDKPTTLPVLFPSNDIEELVFPHFYTRYSGSLLTVKCDGETAIQISKEGARTTEPCRKNTEQDCACGARALGRLNVILAHPDAPFGIFQVPVGGEQRIEDVLDELRIYRSALGKLTDIVFQLERVETVTQVQTPKGRLPKKGWPVHVRCNFSALDALRVRGVTALPGLTTLTPALPVEVVADELTESDLSGDTSVAADDDELPAELRDDAAPDWSIEGIYRHVADLGIEPTVYAKYLTGVYLTADALTATALAEQRTMIETARKDKGEADTFRAIVRGVAGKVAGKVVARK
jgi:hypothetical protein